MTLTVTAKRFFDGQHLYDDRPTAITIRGDRVLDVAVIAGPEPASDDMQRLDASSLTLLPGLIDAHFHPVSASFDIAGRSVAPLAPGARCPSSPRVGAASRFHDGTRCRGGEIVVNRLTPS